MVGKTISHYKVLEKIGEGGMGEAYRSTETGSREVYVQPFPKTGAKHRITQQGGG